MATEIKHAGHFLLSEGNGVVSRDTAIIKKDEVLVAGTVLGRITAGGKCVAYSAAAEDGSDTPIGILYANINAKDADVTATIISRLAEVDKEALTGLDEAAQTALAALNIIAR